MKCENCKHLKNESYCILFENSDWRIVLREDDQEYLGKAVVTLKSHKPRLSDLTNDEWLNFKEIVQWYETAMSRAFVPTHFNWACLMNNAAGRSDETHVHFHVTPRYRQPIELFGQIFTDSRWPQSSRTVTPHPISSNIGTQIGITLNKQSK